MKKLKKTIQILGLNFKKELLIFLGIVLAILGCGILLSILLKSWIFAVIFLGLLVIFSVLYLSRYSNKLDQINRENIEDFSNLFSYFRIYIHNGFSVYSSLKEITLFASPSLRILLEQLILEIDGDKTVQPFINFAHNFNEIIIEEMMISIYQMIDDGEQSDYLKQFEMIFDKFSDLLYQKNLDVKNRKLGTLSSSPLIGSCFLIITLTIGIISVIGELINGL